MGVLLVILFVVRAEPKVVVTVSGGYEFLLDWHTVSVAVLRSALVFYGHKTKMRGGVTRHVWDTSR